MGTSKEEYYIMMHHLWRAAYADKDLGKYDLDKAWAYFEAIESNHGKAPTPTSQITANGKEILQWMKASPNNIGNFIAADIAKGLGISSASVSGRMRKLVAEGFVEKSKYSAVLTAYAITESGIAALE